MSFVRRLFGGRPDAHSGPSAGLSEGPTPPPDDDRDRDLLRDEAARLDELQQRQLRYAEYAWRPAAQGSERRADDEDRDRDG